MNARCDNSRHCRLEREKNFTVVMSEVSASSYKRPGVENPSRSSAGVTTMTISALVHATVLGDENGSCSWMR